jgi:hypothetical protein
MRMTSARYAARGAAEGAVGGEGREEHPAARQIRISCQRRKPRTVPSASLASGSGRAKSAFASAAARSRSVTGPTADQSFASCSTTLLPQGGSYMFRLRHLTLHHLEWLIGELVPDAEMVVYEVLPGAPVQRDRIIERLCGLAGLDVGQAADDPARAERVRQAFGFRRGRRPVWRHCFRCWCRGSTTKRLGRQALDEAYAPFFGVVGAAWATPWSPAGTPIYRDVRARRRMRRS